MLPEAVLQRVKQDLPEWQQSGASVMELSHRGAEFMALAEQIEENFRKLLNIPDNYAVLFTAGGATTQQALLPLNLAEPGQAADYVITGHWSHTALKQASPYVNARVVATDEPQSYQQIPPASEWNLSPDAAYLHITANETIHGVEYRPEWGSLPDTGDIPIVADFSSSIASEPIDISRYGVVYAGAQKNLGASGISLVLIDKSLLERKGQPRANIFKFASHHAAESMLNTPPTFNWYLTGLVIEWMLQQGGVDAFAQRNQVKSQALYRAIDSSDGFYRNSIHPSARSRMNIPFFIQDDALTSLFLAEAKQAGMMGLKGHRVLGGLRASLYNAMPIEGVEVLIQFMQEFQKQHG